MTLAIVVQRYGEEVIGGSERHARLLAEKLAERHQVSVLTTTARDYRTWKNEYPAGETDLNGVRIVRFPVVRKRRWRRFGLLTAKTLRTRRQEAEYRWIVKQGPECPALIDYLRENRDNFDVIIFFTYLYYPTFFGLPVVADKAILVPTAHDEPAIRLSIFQTLFHLPRFIAFNTEEEKRFVHSLFHNAYIPHDVIGIGVELCQAAGQDDGYLLYAGRIEKGKSCEELFDFVARAGVPLKVIGPAQVPVPRHIDYLGVVSEEEKARLLSRCRALVNPSRNESLSLAVLEAWACGKPVVVSGYSPVLKAEVERSGGGYIYSDLEEFEGTVRSIDARKGEAGKRYVAERYSWDAVIGKYEQAFKMIGANE